MRLDGLISPGLAAPHPKRAVAGLMQLDAPITPQLAAPGPEQAVALA